MSETTLENRAEILAEVWMDYRDDEQFTDFVEYNDLGLPLAYAYANGIVQTNELVSQFINETFNLLLAGLGIKEDLGFEVLNDLFTAPTED